MLIKNRLKSINDTVFFSDISTYLFDVNGLFGLLEVFLKQFRTIPSPKFVSMTSLVTLILLTSS